MSSSSSGQCHSAENNETGKRGSEVYFNIVNTMIVVLCGLQRYDPVSSARQSLRTADLCQYTLYFPNKILKAALNYRAEQWLSIVIVIEDKRSCSVYV